MIRDMQILRGQPDATELAALVAVLHAMTARAQAAAPGRARRTWAEPARALQMAPRPAAGAWRRAALRYL